jgi:transcriptional regulator with XRE-family HTH domain
MGYKPEWWEGHLHQTKDLARLAVEARDDLTQKQVANLLDVTKQSVSKAENEEIGSRMNGLRIRIIEEIGGYDIEGPYWVVRPPKDE